jgi:D-methionine transport system ATP-binding protein
VSKPLIPAVIDISGLSKDYHGLRPLRIERLTVAAADRTALLGFDQPMSETFVNLVTGATLPDHGAITLSGRVTSDITDSADWLSVVDRFGIVSPRSVLLPTLSVVQNLSIPFTLDIDPPPEEVGARAGRLAAEVAIPEADWQRPVAELDAIGQLRLRVARALALDPAILLLEHASAGLPREAIASLGSKIQDIASRRGCALLAVGADPSFASVVATRVLVLDQATGRLADQRRKWSLFGGGG